MPNGNSFATYNNLPVPQLTDTNITNPANNNGLVYENGLWVNKPVATSSSTITGTSGELVIIDSAGSGIEATNLGSIDATALTLSNTLKVSNNDSAIGGMSGSLSGTPATLAVDCNNVSYGFIRFQVAATATLTTYSITNLRQNAQIIVHIEGTSSGTLTIQGSDAGGITGAKLNFTADIEIDNGKECLLTIFGSNNKVLVSAGKYI